MYRRGCVIDRKRGNILKLDRHRYVRYAEHGLTEISGTERKQLYTQNHKGSFLLCYLLWILYSLLSLIFFFVLLPFWLICMEAYRVQIL
jgi:hypothetical protein